MLIVAEPYNSARSTKKTIIANLKGGNCFETTEAISNQKVPEIPDKT